MEYGQRLSSKRYSPSYPRGLRTNEGLAVLGQASSVSEAITGIEATVPEAVTLDILLPDSSWVEVPKYCRRGWKVSVVVLTSNLYETRQLKAPPYEQ